MLNGDNIRHGLSRDLGFYNYNRIENVRRVGEVVKIMQNAGLVVLTACIFPYRTNRKLVRKILPEWHFIEVFIDSSLAVCEQRDPKAIYKKAHLGKIKNFTSISSSYEIPENPEVHLNSD